MFDLLRRLCLTPGVSGNETAVSDIIIEQIKGHAEFKIDPLGNIIAFKKGANRAKARLMLCAHMDEVGFIVTYINDSGLLSFSTVGGIDPRVVLGRRVLVGKAMLPGVIATKPVHLQNSDERNTVPSIDKLYIDIGAVSREDALHHVSPGDTAVFDSDFVEFGDGLIKAKAIDDRMGCALLIELIRSELAYDCYFVFSAQEEVGTRGAGAAAFSVQPDAAIVVESTTAADIPFVDDNKKVCYLGRGPVLSFMDKGAVYDRGLFNLALKTGEKKDIRCQVKLAVAGGNDAAAIHLSGKGVRSLAVSLPCRYLHSSCCVINRGDAIETLKLLRELTGLIPGGTLSHDTAAQ